MKKYLMSALTLIMFSFIFSLTARFTTVKAADCTADKLVVHYLRIDGNYDNVGLYTWAGANTGESDGLLPVAGTDSFGGIVNVCIAAAGGQVKTEGDVTTYSVEIIPTTDVTQTNGEWWKSKDSYNGNNVRVDITPLKAEGVTEEHVYIVEGTDTVLYPDTTMGNAIIVYFDATQDYTNWGIHTWSTGTNGSAPGWGEPVPFTAQSYYKSVGTSKMMMAAIKVASDANDTIGFIVHNGDNKKYGSDINLDVTGIKGSGVKVFYYIAGDAGPVTAAQFVENAFVFKFVPFNVAKLTGTYAANKEVIKVELSRDITIKNGDGDVVFDPTYFTLKQGETVVPMIVKYNEAALTSRSFAIQFEDGYTLDNTKAYTLYFDNKETDTTKQLKAEIAVDLDTEAPEITFAYGTDYTVTQGGEFEFPAYTISDNRDSSLNAYVPEGKGFLDTAVLGAQKITLVVKDTWGNETQAEFTVNVVAPEQKANLPLIVGLSVGGVAVVGAAAFFVLKKFSK